MKYTAYDASSAQKRLYLINQLQGDSILYNMPFSWIGKGNLDPHRLEIAVKKVIQRHETLRTCFAAKDGEVFQNVYGSLEFRLEYSEIEENSPKDIDSVFDDFVKPFDLDIVPLWRIRLIRWEPGEQLLLFDIHHIICDGISIGILMHDLMTYYRGGELPEMAYQYVDFTTWQNEQWKSEGIKRQEQYWLNVFAGNIPVLDFPTDYPRSMEADIAGTGIKYEIGDELTLKMNQLASQNNTTLYVVVLAAYYVLLSTYTNQEDIVVGSVASGRTRLEFENIIGMFVNTLALRNRVDLNKTFKEFLPEVTWNTFIAFDNQDYPFEMLVEKVAPQRHLNRNPLFDTILTLQNFSRHMEISDPNEGPGGLLLTPYYYKARAAKFDLTLDVSEEDRHIVILLEYRTSLFHNDTMRRFIEHFINIIREVVTDCHLRLSEIRVISEAEREYLIYELNDTAAGYPTDKTIHRLFEEQAARTPEKVAVVGNWQGVALVHPADKGAVGKRERAGETVQITYRELNRKSDQLAYLLREKGVRPETIVGIMVDRSIGMIIGILGILKAGGAYLPIDPEYPRERIDFMLKDSNARVLVSELSEVSKVSEGTDIVKPSELREEHPTHPTHLCYIIYTSGTTGKPKGVMIEHRNVVPLLFNDKNLFDFSDGDVWTMFHSYCFDFSVWEMYGALLYGGKLIIIPWMAARDPEDFFEILRSEAVTVLNQTPSSFYHLTDVVLRDPGESLAVRYVIFGGESLKPAKLKHWKTRYPKTRFINMYGITETTVHVTYKEITGEEIDGNISNIGRPIPTLSTYVLNRYMKLVPVGVSGEVCVGGEGVGRGYLNRPALTAGKFVENPYKPGERLYRSGDVVRMRGNGDMEYMGRMDHQVKLRGFRVELGEIESQLKNHPLVKKALVILMKDDAGDNRLCAYAVCDKAPDIKELREFLSGRLPGYMIPSHFVALDKLPLTSNGKIDRKALPKPEARTESEYIAPRNEIEKKLVEIWREVLGLGDDTSIGIEDNFFDLGGHSLKATILAAKIHRELDIEIPLTEIFKSPTIR
ncbi:MAG: amino acid adenylation domain-containing protein, partial [Candidatus Aminicenantes bacterium]|nr:amino acid adenylation domain-containing protein [Candidatus Aminicenantes bacterium]NIM82125.1 amino acid adenylation domain-containing protein [Candidatus Aminicenantes bacterium]NIN21522.1 amino acid adenylation domain-containing protein [Candidatus Aminicenantes bacterium]NIN45331.1 amino acid adenylation domain-containing protein [Candidatus Aminicenantes bacterium]NIN88152.1 amino acid adenylation domain-containing protein [Candidatus Aminicenantes bacterium]